MRSQIWIVATMVLFGLLPDATAQSTGGNNGGGGAPAIVPSVKSIASASAGENRPGVPVVVPKIATYTSGGPTTLLTGKAIAPKAFNLNGWFVNAAISMKGTADSGLQLAPSGNVPWRQRVWTKLTARSVQTGGVTLPSFLSGAASGRCESVHILPERMEVYHKITVTVPGNATAPFGGGPMILGAFNVTANAAEIYRGVVTIPAMGPPVLLVIMPDDTFRRYTLTTGDPVEIELLPPGATPHTPMCTVDKGAIFKFTADTSNSLVSSVPVLWNVFKMEHDIELHEEWVW